MYKLKGKGAKPQFSQAALKAGLKSLDSVWAAGGAVKDIQIHLFLTWFLLFEGNLFKSSSSAGIHRNSMIYIFKENRKGFKAFHWRRLWDGICLEHPKEAFDVRLGRFWKNQGFELTLTRGQNKALIGLWKTGFPYKMIRASFWLWALKSGKERAWIMERLGFDHRNSFHYWGTKFKNSDSKTDYWFAPLKSSPGDWYPWRRVGRPRKT